MSMLSRSPGSTSLPKQVSEFQHRAAAARERERDPPSPLCATPSLMARGSDPSSAGALLLHHVEVHLRGSHQHKWQNGKCVGSEEGRHASPIREGRGRAETPAPETAHVPEPTSAGMRRCFLSFEPRAARSSDVALPCAAPSTLMRVAHVAPCKVQGVRCIGRRGTPRLGAPCGLGKAGKADSAANFAGSRPDSIARETGADGSWHTSRTCPERPNKCPERGATQAQRAELPHPPPMGRRTRHLFRAEGSRCRPPGTHEQVC